MQELITALYIVGNAIAPFFVQGKLPDDRICCLSVVNICWWPLLFYIDGIKFPDLIHAGKPEPDKEVPQAGTAHETAYDFFAEFPETLHTVFWALSGRGIPRSFRQVEGFGVHT